MTTRLWLFDENDPEEERVFSIMLFDDKLAAEDVIAALRCNGYKDPILQTGPKRSMTGSEQ